MSDYPITEDELRLPEFRGVKLENLERRDDGAIVRKDRWETGFRSIANNLPDGPRARFEIQDVVDAAERAFNAEDTLNALYRRLVSEQVGLQTLEREPIPDTESARMSRLVMTHRREGITAAIRLLTDLAGEYAYVLRATGAAA